jgi:hypothetical protein
VVDGAGVDLAVLREAYRIPAAWRDLGLPGEPGACVRSPLRPDDSRPSFSIHADGRRWRDHATGDAGSVFDFIRLARGCDFSAAVRWVEERLGLVAGGSATFSGGSPDAAARAAAACAALRLGTADEHEALGALRGFGGEGLKLAESRGILRFGAFARRPAWAVTDATARLVEFRRMDGEVWPAFRHLSERKAHCVGTGKDVPVGLDAADRFERFVLVEGAPDAVAAHHFLSVEGVADSVGVLALLGGAARLSAAAAKRLAGKRVRIFPHVDPAGARSVREWALALSTEGVRVDAFDLSGLIRSDGRPGKDLADVALIAPDCFERERKFWRLLT